MGRRNSAWSEERVERLRVLWYEGWSASECGMELGCSRNAVIGVVHRRGWHYKERQPRPLTSRARHLVIRPPPPEPKPKRVRKPKPARKPKPVAQLLVIPEQVSKEPAVGSFTLMDLRYGVCKWPEGTQPPYSYCGDKALENESYCADHHRRAHQGPQHRALRPIESYAIRRSRQAA